MSKRTAAERFWSKVSKTPGCWLWRGAVRGRGYGAFTMNDRQMQAHHAAMILSGVDIPPGLIVMHRCDEPLCVRPDHLAIGTYQDNSDDMKRKGRYWSERCIATRPLCVHAKLSESEVLEISRSSERRVLLAKRYGVSLSQIYRVQNGERWPHVNRSAEVKS